MAGINAANLIELHMDQMNEAKLLLYKQIKKIFKKQVTLKILYLIELHMDQMNEAKLLL